MIERLFRIQPGEGRRVAAMLVYSIAVVGGVVIVGQLASRALFLSALPRSAIPYKFILPPLALMAVSTFYTRLAGHFRREQMIFAVCAVGALGALGFRLLLATPAGHQFWALCALFVFIDILGSLAVLQFWTFAGDVFDAREARRLFGLIAGGSTVSNVVFGAALGGGAALFDPADLLLAIVSSLLVCAAAVFYLTRCCELPAELGKTGLHKTADAPAGGWGGDLREILSQPLVRSIGAIVLMVALASQIADYLLDLALQSRYGDDGQGMIAFLGSFRFLAGVGSGLLQFFLAGRLLERYGLAAGLALLPVAMAIGSGTILLAAGALWATALPRACDVVLKYTVNDAAINLLYLPIDARLRARAKAAIDGIVKPPLVGLLGLVFLFVDQLAPLTSRQWALPLLAVVLPWLLLVRPAARQYVAALSRSLQLRRLDLDAERMDLSDDSSLQVIRQTLQSAEEGRVLHALTLVEGIDRVDWRRDLLPLTASASPQIRRVALTQLTEVGGQEAVRAINAAVDDPDSAVRAVAVEAICRRAQSSDDSEVAAFLAAADPRTRAAATLGLWRRGKGAALDRNARLTALLEDADPEVRIEGIWVLRRLAQPDLSAHLLPRLLDPDMRVRLAALRATAVLPAPELLAALIPNLTYANLLRETAAAIGRCARDDLEPVPSLVRNQDQPPAVRAALIGILPAAGAGAGAALLPQLESANGHLRLAACQALLALHRQGVAAIETERLRAVLDEEIDRSYQLHAAVRATAERPRAALVREALQARLRDTGARILILLDLLYPELAEDHIRPHLHGDDRRARAAALDLLDSTLPRELRARVLPLFSPTATERDQAAHRLGYTAGAADDHLRALEDQDDPWLAQCARFALDNPRPGDRDMAMSTLERVFFLKSVPLFEPIPGEELGGLVPILHEVSFPPGETFIQRGESADYLYIIVEGQVEIRRDGKVFVSGPTEVIGERAVLAQTPRHADCTALTDVVALRVDQEDFWQLMREQPNFTIEVMKVVVDRYMV